MVSFTPAEGSLLTSASLIPFEPNAYDQNSKKKIVIKLSQEETETVQAWENAIDAKKLCSCINRHGVRVRFDPEIAQAWKGEAAVPMPPLKNAVADVRITLSGIWEAGDKSGICCKATDIYLKEDQNALQPGTDIPGLCAPTQQSEPQPS